MPLQICYITKYGTSDSLLRDICNNLGIQYTYRDYDSLTYSTDREYIERLPAFHLLDNKNHIGTYYPDKDIDRLESIVTQYTLRQEKRKLYSWKRVFTRLLKTDSRSNKRQRVDIPTRTQNGRYL